MAGTCESTGFVEEDGPWAHADKAGGPRRGLLCHPPRLNVHENELSPAYQHVLVLVRLVRHYLVDGTARACRSKIGNYICLRKFKAIGTISILSGPWIATPDAVKVRVNTVSTLGERVCQLEPDQPLGRLACSHPHETPVPFS